MRIAAIISSLLFPILCFGQSLTVKSSSSKIGLGQRVKITYTLEGSDGNKFIQPTFTGFRLLSGPNTASSMQWVNGKFSSSKSFSFILLAQEIGEHTISPASIKVKGKEIKSDPITIAVVKASQAKKKNQQQQRNQQQQQAPATADLSTNLFLKLFVTKRDVYVGEQFVATYKLYTNVGIRSHESEPPSNNGFYAQEIEIDPNKNHSREKINGQVYEVYTLKKSVLTPQQSGELEIPPLKMDFVLQIPTNQSRTVFNPWGGYKNVSYSAQSNKQVISVNPLPNAGKPANFAGAVGDFKITINQDRNAVSLNEAVNLRVEISGDGNLELITEPSIEFPQDFETYDPKIKENISLTGSGSKGKKTFEYVLIPRYAGQFEIEPPALSFFNTKTKSYETVRTEPIKIDVAKSADAANSDVAYIAPKKEDVQIIGKDIRFIKPLTSDLTEPSEPFFGSAGFYALSTLPFASTALALLLISRIRARESDVVYTKSRRAKALAKKRLANAKASLASDGSVFYEEIFKALYGYLGDKFNIPSSELSKDIISAQLLSKGCSNEAVEKLLNTLNECEMARFAPGQAMEKSELLANSESLIQQIENEA